MKRILLITLGLIGFVSAASAVGLLPPLSAGDMVLGPAEAPVTVVEYSSMTCPHCAKWDVEVFPQVKKNWIETNKIRFVFRDFPLDGLALKASQLAHCSGDQRFWGFIDALYSSQNGWARSADPISELVKVGKLGGLSEEKSKACMADEKLANAIVASRTAASDAGVNATPTFFFNGKLVSGEVPYEQFVKNLQEAGVK
jgi:protein-disulfide isomerase